MAGYLDFTLGEPGVDWRITVGGVDVSDIVVDGSQAEWSLFQLNSPAPIIQIGSINLEAAELSPVSIDLRGIQPDTLVQGFWRGTLQWSARVLQNEITSWDRFGDNVQAVTLRLTDRLGQALASNDLVNPVWINSGFIMPWYDYAAAQIRSRGNVAVNTSGLESLQGSGENDGYSYPQDSGDNPVLFAAGVAACRGFALWCDPNEVVQFLRYPDIPAPSRRYSRDQVDEFEPDFAVEPPAKEVTVSGDFTRQKRLDLGEARTTTEVEFGEIPSDALTAIRRNIDVRRVFTTVEPFNPSNSTQVTYRRVIARRFALPNADSTDIFALSWVEQEETETITSFRRRNTVAEGLLDSIRTIRTVNRKVYIPDGSASNIRLPDDVERWVYDANGIPVEHIIEKGDAMRSTVDPSKILTFISERVIERFYRINSRQAEMYRAVFRTNLDSRGFFNPALRIVESKTEPIDQIPSPPAQPETRELETVTFVRRAAIEGGTGQSVDVTVPGVTSISAQTFCNFYALVEGRRRNPIVVSRPLEPNESIRPLDREDIHNKALIRDGISVQYNPSEGSAVLSYSGWLAGTFSPPVQIPPRKPPSGNLSGILTIQPLDPFTTVQGFAIAPIRLDAFGGTPPYVFGAPSLPTGLTISGSNIIGTPTVAFDGLVTVTVTDAAMDTSQFEWDLTVTATLPILDPTVRLALGTVAVSQTFSVVGTVPPVATNPVSITETFAVVSMT